MLTLIRCPFHPPQWHVKDPGHSAKSAGGRLHRLHLNTHTIWTQRSRSGLTMLVSRHSVETYPETSSHAACQGTFGQFSQLAELLWTDSGTKSGISVRELISTSKKKKKNAWAGYEQSNILPKSSQARKNPPPPLHSGVPAVYAFCILCLPHCCCCVATPHPTPPFL